MRERKVDLKQLRQVLQRLVDDGHSEMRLGDLLAYVKALLQFKKARKK